jgi:hypothetical protein
MDIYGICIWLCAEREKIGAQATSAKILIQILQSTLMPKLLIDTDVIFALSQMFITKNVHLGLDAVNHFMELSTDVIAERYIQVLQSEHDELFQPPFPATDSRLWYYREWPVSHVNHLFMTVRQ